MKILYLANIRLPTEKAHGLQILKTCEAFALAAADVTLIVPRRFTPIKEAPFEYYGIKKHFKIVYLPTLDTVHFGKVGFFIETGIFSAAAFVYSLFVSADIIFSRDEAVLWPISSFKKNIVWESHTGAANFAARSVAKNCKKLVAISSGVKSLYTVQGIDAQKIIVAHDGVDLSAFSSPEPLAVARERLHFPQDKKIALYIGRLDGWKGVDTLCKASELLPDIRIGIIGGEEAQVKAMRAKYPKVIFAGYRPYKELADNQAAADVLVLPNTGKDDISANLTSPLKLFTYMASGKPIVASDLPSLREVLNDESCYFAKADDPQSFADVIRRACTNGAESDTKATVARSLVEGYTWEARANIILTKI